MPENSRKKELKLMQEPVRVTGMVLEVSPVGETDRRVVLLTKERGKISAFARGARKQGSRLMAATNPFCFGEFILYEGTNSYSLSEAVIRNYFEDMRMHFEEACYGMYFLELMDYYTRENNDEREMLLLLYQSLRALLHAAYDNRLVRYIFEIKAVVLNGEYPGLPKNKDYEESTRYALQYIADSSVEKLYSFKVSDEVLQELEEIAGIYQRRFVDRKMKSLEILEISRLFRCLPDFVKWHKPQYYFVR